MEGKTKDMSQIKQMLLLKKQGVSNRKIAKAVGINKETVNNYISKAVSDELGIEGLLKLDDPILERRLKGGNAAYTDERFAKFKELLPYLQEELTRKHVTLKLLWEEYIRENPEGYSLTQFRYHYRQNAVATKQPPSTVLCRRREYLLRLCGQHAELYRPRDGRGGKSPNVRGQPARQRLRLRHMRSIPKDRRLRLRHHHVLKEHRWST